jgi:glucose/arabinose dehydrogenase
MKQPYSNHNGGSIAFGPDGYLYIGFGDGGSAGDPENNAQNLNNYLGKILRINVDTNPEKYTIPQNNPFIGKKNAKEEILCFGLRNPWRFSFDLLTGDLFIGDVGQNNWEEIDVIPGNNMGGQNFGWNIMEGFHCYPEEIDCNKTNLNEPIWEYPNNANYLKTLVGIKQNKMDGCSITGGYVYRGSKIPEFYGRYIFGDYCTGKVWSFAYENGEAGDIKNHTSDILNSMNKNSFYLSSFGETIDGELLIVDYNGGIYIITSL